MATLDLRSNRLSGNIPRELGNLTKLNHVLLSDNRLSGTIPPELGNLTLASSGVVFLNDNQLSGVIPTELSDLSNLRRLRLNRNRLSGAIPTELGNLNNLNDLWLHSNKLTGAIPTELTTMTSLRDLDLSDNQLSGAIPPALSNLSNLQYLYLSDNQLSGGIPTALGSLANLRHLVLNNNQLNGAIPTALGNLANLQRLYLSNNQLSGAIPTALGSLTTNLRYLLLQGNQLSGAIPTALGSLNLFQLSLDNNQLSGGIPTNLNNMYWLFLHNNQLSGEIPTTNLDGLTNLQELSFWGNSQLTWTSISTELGKRVDRAALSSLYKGNNGENWRNKENWLDSTNLFSFSSWYGVMTNSDGRVSELNLPSNGLTGEITNALEVMGGLESLDLSYNRPLSGTLPVRLRNIASLTSLDISCTRVSVPDDMDFQDWLGGDGIDFRRQPCPPPSPPPPVIDEGETEGVQHSEDAENNFSLTPKGEGGSIVYRRRTINISVTRDPGVPSDANPAVVVSQDILDDVRSITFHLSEDSPENPPSGFRLGGLVADIDLAGVTLSAGETVTVCLPPAGDGEESHIYHYDEVSERWERLESETKTVNDVQLVCGETDAFSRFGVFIPVIDEEKTEGVQHSEDAENNFSLTPVGVGGSIVYGDRTIYLSVTGDVDPSSGDPAVIVPRSILDRFQDQEIITFELSEVSPQPPPPGLRLEGFVAEVDLGITLGEGETVVVCLPSAGGSDLYRYNDEGGEWELPEPQLKTVNGEDVVCAEAGAVSLTGVFVEETGGGCAVAAAEGEVASGERAAFNLLLIISVLLLIPGRNLSRL
ncbi:MAG: hypothetical protein F4Y23_04830 [Candidatus Dadabacteria bacterium]|nr:hypothetical protein [Candidatus Dadabacteria bacterium]